MKHQVVAIDEELKKKAVDFIKKKENKFDYPNLKNFVDIAVIRLLEDSQSRRSNKSTQNP